MPVAWVMMSLYEMMFWTLNVLNTFLPHAEIEIRSPGKS